MLQKLMLLLWTASASISFGSPDKSQLSRTELWTKDVIDYIQGLLEEFFSRNNSHSTHHTAGINHNKFFMLGQYSKRVISYQWQVLPGGQFQVNRF